MGCEYNPFVIFPGILFTFLIFCYSVSFFSYYLKKTSFHNMKRKLNRVLRESLIYSND